MSTERRERNAKGSAAERRDGLPVKAPQVSAGKSGRVNGRRKKKTKMMMKKNPQPSEKETRDPSFMSAAALIKHLYFI